MKNISEEILVDKLSFLPEVYTGKAGFAISDKKVIVGAIGCSEKEVFEKTLSELLERYFLYFSRLSNTLTFSDIRNNMKKYFSYETNHIDTDLFVQGKNLLGNELFVPIEYIKMFLNSKTKYTNSSVGTACHYSKRIAIKNAVFEMLERNTLMKFWKNESELILLEEYSNYLSKSLKNFCKNNEVKIFLLTTEYSVITVFSYIVRNKRITFGSSCKQVLIEAIEASIFEAMQLLNNIENNLYLNLEDNSTYSRIFNLSNNPDCYKSFLNVLITSKISYADFNSKMVKLGKIPISIIENSFFFKIGNYENREVWKVFNSHFSNNYNELIHKNKSNLNYPFP